MPNERVPKSVEKSRFTDVDLNLLVAFEAVMHRQSISRAAEDLGLTQSALSNAMTRLRKALGDPLFVRTSAGMSPTPRAIALEGPIAQALALIRAATTTPTSFDPATSRRVFVIVMSDVGQIVIVPSLLERLQHSAPDAAIKTLQLSTTETRAALESGEADLAIGFLPELQAGFHAQRLFREKYVCIARRDHPRIGDSLTLERFSAERHAVASVPGTGHAMIEQTMAKLNLQHRIALYVNHFAAIPIVVGSTDLIATVPSRLVTLFQDVLKLRVLQCPIAPDSFDVRQLWHERYHQDPVSQWFRREIASLFRDRAS